MMIVKKIFVLVVLLSALLTMGCASSGKGPFLKFFQSEDNTQMMVDTKKFAKKAAVIEDMERDNSLGRFGVMLHLPL